LIDASKQFLVLNFLFAETNQSFKCNGVG
jgi:hypothetical protein